jgi:hypothetical protein
MPKRKNIALDFEIDKLTNSIENTITGDSLPTVISPITQEDLAKIKKDKTWQFDWNKEQRLPGREIYKLTVYNNPDIIQGLINLETKSDHIYMGLIKEPANVDFTVISKVWTAEEENEFSELIKKQKEARSKKCVRPSASLHLITKRNPLRKKKEYA